MDYLLVPMNADYANEIAHNWKYDGIYAFYNMTSDEDDLKEFLDPANWDGKYFAVLGSNKDLVGFFQFDFRHDVVEIGLGLKPELTGKGLGKGFVSAGLEYIQKSNPGVRRVVLNVACFNERAVRLYKSLGFTVTNTKKVETNGSLYDFFTMEKELD